MNLWTASNLKYLLRLEEQDNTKSKQTYPEYGAFFDNCPCVFKKPILRKAKKKKIEGTILDWEMGEKKLQKHSQMQ